MYRLTLFTTNTKAILPLGIYRPKWYIGPTLSKIQTQLEHNVRFNVQKYVFFAFVKTFNIRFLK